MHLDNLSVAQLARYEVFTVCTFYFWARRSRVVDLGRRRAVGSARRMADAFDGLFAVEQFLRGPVGMVARDGKHGIPRPLDLEEDLALYCSMRYVPVLGAIEEVVDSLAIVER